MSDTRPLEIALVTGMSGAGRSTAARALEDVGWFVMDNLPPALLAQAIALATRTEEVDRIAVVVDVRSGSDVVIDTSSINVHDLRRKVEAAFAEETPEDLRATVLSFGFKYGIPVDADLVADMRFLENPHWNEQLRPMSGLDEPVSQAVINRPEARQFYDLYVRLLETMRPGYLTEGKRYVTIAVGCTGGKHRSVASAEELARRMRQIGISTLVVHRDLGRE